MYILSVDGGQGRLGLWVGGLGGKIIHKVTLLSMAYMDINPTNCETLVI